MRRSSSFLPLSLVLGLCFLAMPSAFAQKEKLSHTPLFDSGQITSMLLQSLWELARTFWYVGVMFIAVGVVRILMARAQYRKLAASGIHDIDQMDGRTFEQYLETLFEKLGYKVELTPYAGDWGADLVIHKDDIKTVVQAKRYAKSVGVKAVQEVVASKNKYGSAAAMVVTNSSYTKAAQELARVNSVTLWDRQHLVQALLSVNLSTGSTVKDTKDAAVSSFKIQNNDSCCICSKPVSEKVLEFCRDNPGKFGGKVYCFEHQRQAARAS